MTPQSQEAEHDRIQQWYAGMYERESAPEPSMTPAEYRGLYGEVVTYDTYHLRCLAIQPDVVFDIGANVGVFARFARSVFPSARIVCVEPDERNFANLQYLSPSLDNVVFVNKAIGQGNIFHADGAVNGAHECYMGDGSVLLSKRMGPRHKHCDVLPIMLDELAVLYWPPPESRVAVKIDIESAERAIFEHEPSMQVLDKADYFAIELHAGDKLFIESLDRFNATHHTSWNQGSCMFRGIKKRSQQGSE